MPQSMLHFKSYGTPRAGRPALVFLHGLFGSSTNWGGVARRLASDHQVFAVDLRNHGQSFHDPETGYPALAADVRAFIDAEVPGGFAIVGHSMGGKVAMQLALTDPTGLAGIAVVDMAPVSYTHGFEAVFGALDAVDLARLRNRGDADRMMAAHLEVEGLRAFLLQNLVRVDGAWRWRLNVEGLRKAQAVLTGFEAPTAAWNGVAHFIYGTASDYVRPEHRPVIETLFPGAVFCPVADAGHWVYADKPEGFANCLGGFLNAM